jgi:CBS domain-containing protein
MVQHHANRIGLVEPNGTFSSILTQHRVIKWLAGMEQTDMGARLGSASVGQLGIGFRTVLTVKRDQPVFAAFLAMYNQRVSGVAVTDENNTFLGNISISDLKDIGHVGQNYDKLFMTVGNFLTSKSEGLGVPNVVYATRNASLKEVLGKFKSYFVHRVYIVEKVTHKLEGVITPSDILQLFAKSTVRAAETTVTAQQQQQQQISPSDADFLALMNQMESMGGLLPLMMELMGGPEFSMFAAPEYGAFPAEPLLVWEREPVFGTVVPPTPWAATQPSTPARIDVVEDIKVTQKTTLPAVFREGTLEKPAQQNA